MFTPGMGPATEGLNGVELFEVVHALSAISSVSAPAARLVWHYTFLRIGSGGREV
jgi:hypothetical protein